MDNFEKITSFLSEYPLLRSIFKRIKIIMRKHADTLYLYFRYGSSNPLTANYWDKIWMEEGMDTWRLYPRKFDFITSLVPAKSNVLDVGCGVGILLGRLKKERQCIVCGVDISPKAIGIARRSGIEGAVCRLPDLPLESERFDVVIATELIEHLRDPRKAIEQMHRVLRHDGLLILSTPNDCIPPSDCDEHFQCFTGDSLRELVVDLLNNVEISSVCGDDLVMWGFKKTSNYYMR